MVDIANLSFSIDSSQAQAARRDLQELRQASSDAAGQAKELRERFTAASAGMKELAAANAELMRSMRENTTIFDQAVEKMDRLQKQASLFGSTGREMREVVGQLESLGRVFGASSAGVENFARASRQIGLDANETVSALRRIQAAIEGVTSEGRAARAVLEGAGVSLTGLGRDDAAQVLRSYAARSRATQDDTLMRYEHAALGITNPATLQRLDDDRFRSTEQRERERRLSDQAAEAAPRRNDALRAMATDERRRDRLADLEKEWGTTAEWMSPLRGLFETDQQRFNALERRELQGIIDGERPWSQTFAGRLSNAAERASAERPSLLSDPLRWGMERVQDPIGVRSGIERMVAPFRRLADDYYESDTYQANRLAIDAQYQDDRWRDDGLIPIRSMANWALRRGRLMLGDDSVDSQVTSDRGLQNPFHLLLGAGSAVPQLPPDRRPLPSRTPNYDRETNAIGLLGRMTPVDEQLRRIYGQAAQEFGINSAGWDRMTAPQIWALAPGRQPGQGGFRPDQRDAITRRIETADAARNEAFGERLQDFQAMRDSWRAGAASGGYANGERAAYQAEAEARAKTELVTVEQRRLRVLMEMAEFDDRRRLVGEQQTQQLREQTRATEAYTDASRQAIAQGRTAIEAQAAGTIALVDARTAANPRGPTARALIDDRFAGALQQAWQGRIETGRTIEEEEQRLVAARGGLDVLAQTNAELQKQRDLRGVIQAATEAAAAGDADALRKLREISDEYDRQRRLLSQISTERREIAYREETGRIESGNRGDFRTSLGPEGLYAVRLDRFMRANAANLLGEHDERLVGLQGSERNTEAYRLLTADQRRELGRRFLAEDYAGSPERAAAAAAQYDIARLRTNPDPRAARDMQVSEAQIMSRARGEGDTRSLAAGTLAGLIFDLNMERDSRGLVFQAERGAQQANARTDYLLGGGIPRQAAPGLPRQSDVDGGGEAPRLAATLPPYAVPVFERRRRTDQEFAAEMGPYAAAAAERLGVAPETVLGHWSLETHNGRAFTGQNNLGNMTALLSQPGTEGPDRDARGNPITQRFRDFASPSEFVDSYISWVQRRAPSAMGAGANSLAFGQALGAAGYATDPRFAASLAGAANRFQGVPLGVDPLPVVPTDANPRLQGALRAEGPRQMPTDVAGLRQLLYGSSSFDIRAQSAELVSAGRLEPARQADYEVAEGARRASQALAEFAQQTVATSLALAEGEQRINAGSSYERGRLGAVSQAEAQAVRLRDLAGQLPETDPRRRRMLDAADQAVPQANARYAQGSRERFDQESRQTNWQVGDAQFEADNWWRSSWSLRREMAIRQTRRRMKDTYGDSIGADEREDLVQRSGQVAQYSEINRITQAMRESFLGMGQAASAALEQIVLRGGTARQVMSALLATMASTAFRQASGLLISSGFDFIGSRIFGSGGGAAVGTGLDALGAELALMPSAQGNVIEGGRLVRHFARGGEATTGDLREGIVDRSTYFRMAGGGRGLMGEAGTEGVFELVPRRDGSRGVRLVRADGRPVMGDAAPITRDSSGRLALAADSAPTHAFATGGNAGGAMGIFPLVQAGGGRYGVPVVGRDQPATIVRDRDGRLGVLADQHFAAGGVVGQGGGSPMLAAAKTVLDSGSRSHMPAPPRQAPQRVSIPGVSQTIHVNVQGGQGGAGGGGASSPEQTRMMSDALRRAAREGAEDAIANQMRLGNMLNPVQGF